MSRVERVPRARADLAGHIEWLFAYDADVAARIVGRVIAKATWLADLPLTGTPLATAGLRKSNVARTRYFIIYQPMFDYIRVLRVIHGSQNWR